MNACFYTAQGNVSCRRKNNIENFGILGQDRVPTNTETNRSAFEDDPRSSPDESTKVMVSTSDRDDTVNHNTFHYASNNEDVLNKLVSVERNLMTKLDRLEKTLKPKYGNIRNGESLGESLDTGPTTARLI